MSKITLFIAPLGAGNKKTNIFKEIVSYCPEGDYSSFLYITPTAIGAAETRKEFFYYFKATCKKTTCSRDVPAYIPFQAIPLRQLCINLYESYAEEKEIVPDDLEPLLLCEVMAKRDLGYASLLSGLLYKLRHYLLNKSLSTIKEEINHLIFEKKARIWASTAIETLMLYEKRLEERGLIDVNFALKSTTNFIKEHLKTSLVVFDGFFDPTPLELKIIKSIIEKAEKVLVLLEEEAEFLRFFESLETNEKWEIRSEKLKKTISTRENTRYYIYPSMEEEVEGIAKRVKGLILEGTKPWEIIVSFPLLSKYLPMLKRIFQKHGIPLSIVQYDLSSVKPVVALEDMLISIEEDYPRNEFLSFLTSHCFVGIPEVIKEWVIIYANRAGIIKGRETWLSIRDRVLKSTQGEISEQEKNLLNEIQKAIKSVLNALERIRGAKNLRSFIDELEDALNRFGFLDSIGEFMLDALNNQFTRLRHFAEVFGSSVKGIEGADYIRYLVKELKGFDESEHGVRVLPYEFAAGFEPKALFFGGIIEGDFPSRPEIDPILPERVKKVLGLPFLEYYIDRQKRYFKRLLNISRDEPYFSHPSQDGDKVFLPSPFLEWGEGITPPLLNILSEEEVLIRKGFSKQKDFSNVLWDGRLIGKKGIRNFLKSRVGKKSFIKVTDIDAYRKCPLRFYIEKVLGLEIEKPPKFEVEARLWGSLAHKVMEYLYREGDVDLEDIDKRITGGLEKALKEFPVGKFWSRVAKEIFQRLIPVIKEQEAEIKVQGFSPYRVEHNLRAEINSLRLKGKIDRVDKKFQITNSKLQTPDSVILLDYKTGFIDKDSLQLPLYAAMWQKENKEVVEKVGFYSLREGLVEWYPLRGVNIGKFIEEALRIAEEITQKMREGIFVPAPFRDTECRYCEHSALCSEAK